jgi:hypothetical protein
VWQAGPKESRQPPRTSTPAHDARVRRRDPSGPAGAHAMKLEKEKKEMENWMKNSNEWHEKQRKAQA